MVLKDTVSENNRVSFRLPGTVKDFPHVRVLKALSNGGYRGEICCEVSSMVWRAKGYDPKTATKTCLRNMERMLEEAEIQRSR